MENTTPAAADPAGLPEPPPPPVADPPPPGPPDDSPEAESPPAATAEIPPPLNDRGDAPPVEVERDIAQELTAMDHAVAAGGAKLPDAFNATAPADPLAFDANTGLSDGAFYPEPSQPGLGHEEPARTPMKVARTLEDLCANFDRLQTGECWLRVERKSPATHRGAPCAGWIENCYQALTEIEFQERYGGGTYVVRVQGPQANAIDGDGKHRARTFATLDNFKIAGAPRATHPDENDDMHNRRFSVHRGGAPPDAHVQIKHAELDERRRERELTRVDKLHDRLLQEKERSHDPNMLSSVAELAEARANDIREAASEALATQRSHNQRLTGQLDRAQADLLTLRDDKDKIVAELREEVFQVRQEAEQRANQQETTRIRELKDNHDRELKRVREDQTDKLETLAKEHARVTGELSTRADRERADMIANFDRERRELKESATVERRDFIERLDRQETKAQNDLRTKVESEQRSFEARLAETDRASQRELRSFKDSYESRLQSIQALESGKSMSAQNSASLHVSLMQQELARAHAQIDELARENSSVRDRIMALTSKDPMQAFTEAQQMVDSLRGDRDEPGDWKTTVGSIVKNLTDRAPDIVKEINGVREQNRQLAHQRSRQLGQRPPHPQQQARAQQQQQQARAHRAPPPGMQHAPQQQPQGPPPMTAAHGGPTRAPAPPAPLGSGPTPQPTSAPLWSGNPPSDPLPAPGPEMTHLEEQSPAMTNPHPAPPMVQIPQEQQPAPHPPPQQPPPPPQQQTPSPSQAGPPIPPPQPGAVPQLPPPPEPAPVSPEPEPVDIPEEAFSFFTSQLDEAIKGGLVDEGMFASEFIKRVGPEIASRLVQTLSPEQYLTAIEQGGGGNSAIATRKGQRYVHTLWTEARRQLGFG